MLASDPTDRGADPSCFEDVEVVRLAERLVQERLGLAADAASAYLEGVARTTSTGLVVVAATLVETGELPPTPT